MEWGGVVQDVKVIYPDSMRLQHVAVPPVTTSGISSDLSFSNGPKRQQTATTKESEHIPQQTMTAAPPAVQFDLLDTSMDTSVISNRLRTLHSKLQKTVRVARGADPHISYSAQKPKHAVQPPILPKRDVKLDAVKSATTLRVRDASRASFSAEESAPATARHTTKTSQSQHIMHKKADIYGRGSAIQTRKMPAGRPGAPQRRGAKSTVPRASSEWNFDTKTTGFFDESLDKRRRKKVVDDINVSKASKVSKDGGIDSVAKSVGSIEGDVDRYGFYSSEEDADTTHQTTYTDAYMTDVHQEDAEIAAGHNMDTSRASQSRPPTKKERLQMLARAYGITAANIINAKHLKQHVAAANRKNIYVPKHAVEKEAMAAETAAIPSPKRVEPVSPPRASATQQPIHQHTQQTHHIQHAHHPYHTVNTQVVAEHKAMVPMTPHTAMSSALFEHMHHFSDADLSRHREKTAENSQDTRDNTVTSAPSRLPTTVPAAGVQTSAASQWDEREVEAAVAPREPQPVLTVLSDAERLAQVVATTHDLENILERMVKAQHVEDEVLTRVTIAKLEEDAGLADTDVDVKLACMYPSKVAEDPTHRDATISAAQQQAIGTSTTTVGRASIAVPAVASSSPSVIPNRQTGVPGGITQNAPVAAFTGDIAVIADRYVAYPSSCKTLYSAARKAPRPRGELGQETVNAVLAHKAEVERYNRITTATVAAAGLDDVALVQECTDYVVHTVLEDVARELDKQLDIVAAELLMSI